MFTWLQKLKEQWREANQKARQEMTAKTLETMEPHVLDAVEKDKGRFIIEIPRRLKNPDEVKEVVVAHFRPIVEAKGYEILITPHDQNWCVTFSHPEKSVQERQELIVDLIRGIKKHIENKETRFGLELALFFLETYPTLQNELIDRISPIAAAAGYTLSETTDKEIWRIELKRN